MWIMRIIIMCSYSSIQEFQKEVVKAAETFTAVGYKHIEAGMELVVY